MFTKQEIENQLKQFQIEKGRPVTVHTSLKAIGEIEGRAEALLSVLIDYFTKDGGIFFVPTHTWNGTVYDMNSDSTCLGVLPRIAAGHPGGMRSAHPTHSVAAFGEKTAAAAFVCGEDLLDTPTNPKGCYGKLYDEDGYILLIGVGHDKCTYLHCVEEMLDVPHRLTEEKVERTIIYKDGRKEIKHLRWFDTTAAEDVSVFFNKFEPAFLHHGCIQQGFIGHAPAQLCSAKKIKAVMELIYRNAAGKELLSDDKPLDERLYKV